MNNSNIITISDQEQYQIEQIRNLKKQLQALWNIAHSDAEQAYGDKKIMLNKLTKDLQQAARSEDISVMTKAIELSNQRIEAKNKADRVKPLSATERVNQARTKHY